MRLTVMAFIRSAMQIVVQPIISMPVVVKQTRCVVTIIMQQHLAITKLLAVITVNKVVSKIKSQLHVAALSPI